MVTVLMSGPLAASGGVSTHTKNLISCLKQQGIGTILSNQWNMDRYDHKEGSLITKFYQRTMGLAKKCITCRDRIDVIHVQASGGLFAFIPAVTAVFTSKLINKPLVVTFHHSQTKKFVYRHKFLFYFVLRNVGQMIFVSDTQKRGISELFPTEVNRITVVPNGYVSKLHYLRGMDDCREILNLPKGKKIIFNISNLIPTKGHKYLIEAMKDIIKKNPDVICYIAGRGALMQDLEQQILGSCLENHVKLVGWISDKEVPIWMGAADLFVLPSLAESFGIVQIEALACGRPVVATRNGGSESIITSGEYGLLTEPGDVEGLSRMILLALNREWDQEAILEYAKRFTWARIAEDTIKVYRSLI